MTLKLPFSPAVRLHFANTSFTRPADFTPSKTRHELFKSYLFQSLSFMPTPALFVFLKVPWCLIKSIGVHTSVPNASTSTDTTDSNATNATDNNATDATVYLRKHMAIDSKHRVQSIIRSSPWQLSPRPRIRLCFNDFPYPFI